MELRPFNRGGSSKGSTSENGLIFGGEHFLITSVKPIARRAFVIAFVNKMTVLVNRFLRDGHFGASVNEMTTSVSCCALYEVVGFCVCLG